MRDRIPKDIYTLSLPNLKNSVNMGDPSIDMANGGYAQENVASCAGSRLIDVARESSRQHEYVQYMPLVGSLNDGG